MFFWKNNGKACNLRFCELPLDCQSPAGLCLVRDSEVNFYLPLASSHQPARQGATFPNDLGEIWCDVAMGQTPEGVGSFENLVHPAHMKCHS